MMATDDAFHWWISIKVTLYFLQVGQPPSSSIGEIDMEGCGRSKGCYRNPEGCRESYCDLVITWVNMEKDVHFELSGDTEGWVALGFSKDKKMVRPWSFDSLNGRSTDELKIVVVEKKWPKNEKNFEVLYFFAPVRPTEKYDPLNWDGRCHFFRLEP